MVTLNKAAWFEKIGYKPHPGQWEYHNSEARFRVPCCGRRFGKSQMAAADKEPSLLLPGTFGWIVGPTYELGSKEFKYIWMDLMITMGLRKDKRTKAAFNKKQGDMYIETPFGGRVEVRSATHPESLVGDGLDWVIFSEAAKHDKETWTRFIRPALADKRGSADFPSTPEGYNWYYDLYMKGKRGDNDWWSRRLPAWRNPYVYPDGENDPEIMDLKSMMDEAEFKQEIGADFSTVGGRIFDEFDEEMHLVSDYKYNPEWPNYMAIDWGYSAPLAAIEFQVSPSEDIYVWREHYESHRMIDEHIHMWKTREDPEGYHLTSVFGDSADPEQCAFVSNHFHWVEANQQAKANWLQGIRLMKKYLKPRHDGVSYDEYGVPIDRPKYFVSADCKNHIRELSNYKLKDGLSTEREAKASGVAAKTEDHTIDAMRYGLMHVFVIGTDYHLADYAKPMGTPALAPVGPTYFQRSPGMTTKRVRF